MLLGLGPRYSLFLHGSWSASWVNMVKRGGIGIRRRMDQIGDRHRVLGILSISFTYIRMYITSHYSIQLSF